MALGKKQIIETVKALGWPSEQYLVYAGTVLAAHGIRPADDIDIVVSSDFFTKLQQDQEWQSTKPSKAGTHFLERGDVEVASKLRWPNFEITLQKAKEREDTIDDIPFMSLSDVLKIKQNMNRQKDREDIQLIKEYLQVNS